MGGYFLHSLWFFKAVTVLVWFDCIFHAFQEKTNVLTCYYVAPATKVSFSSGTPLLNISHAIYYVPDKGIYMNHTGGLFGAICSALKKHKILRFRMMVALQVHLFPSYLDSTC